MSDADVYVVFPNVNDPFGMCFVVPAMIACTCAKAAALVVDIEIDMGASLLSEGSDSVAALCSEPQCSEGRRRAGFAALKETLPRRSPIPRARRRNRPRRSRFPASARKDVRSSKF